MANELDEMTSPIEDGRDVNIIETTPAKVGAGSIVFEVFLWVNYTRFSIS